MRRRCLLFALGLVVLIVVGLVSSATAIEELVDLTPSYGGIQWVVEDPVQHYLIAGTGFTPGGNEAIWDNSLGTFSWQQRQPVSVGESLYVVLHPKELQGHPDPSVRRRVFIASENTGLFGYYDAATNGGAMFGPAPPHPADPREHLCGTSIGYRPDLDTVYFGFVDCNGPITDNFNTHIHKHHISSGVTTYNVGFIENRTVHGPWILIGGQLYNTAHDVNNRQVCFRRQDADGVYHEFFPCIPLPVGLEDGGAYFNHAKFMDGGYYSEFDFDPTGPQNRAHAYRVFANPDGTVGWVTSDLTAMAFTFLEDTVRTPNQLFAFVTNRDGSLTVACSLDGVSFLKSESASSLGRYGPTGSVATVWQQPDGGVSVVWGHTPTAKNVPSHAIVNRSFLSCHQASTPPATATSLTADVTFPVPAGTQVTWTATSTGGTAPLEYRFWRFDVATSTWTMVRDYTTSNTFLWATSSADVGQHKFGVWVRSAGSTADYESTLGTAVFTITAATATATSLTADVTFPVPAGTQVTWTATATGGTAPLEYRFWRYDVATSTWTMVRDYTTSNTFLWATSSADVGQHKFGVWVRSAGSTADYESTLGTSVFTIQP